MNSRLTSVTGYVVLAVWIASLIAGFVTRDYLALQLAMPAVLLYIGWVFGDTVFGRRRNGNGRGE